MAKDTELKLQKAMIYSIFVRNYSEEGTFRAVEQDLARIKALGTDYIWLLPIHPIGVKGRKGTVGSPYANQDYRAINPDLGSVEDFEHLVNAIHEAGMKVMMDVVYNHTSPDSVLVEEHPEFFYRKPDGSMGNKLGDWTDVVDLDYSNVKLWFYQIETLKMWARFVDGFRCDVAPMVPIEFWQAAREAVRKVNPDCIWLAESNESRFISFCHRHGIANFSDIEGYQAFDMEYAYDTRDAFAGYLRGDRSLRAWLDVMNEQAAALDPHNVKLQFLENHDQPRIASFIKEDRSLRNFTAFLYFSKGAVLLYNGQEYETAHLPELFEKDPIPRSAEAGRDLSGLIARLARIRREILSETEFWHAEVEDEICTAVCYRSSREHLTVGVFDLHVSVPEALFTVSVDVPDGTYQDEISGKELSVSAGRMRFDGQPVIFRVR